MKEIEVKMVSGKFIVPLTPAEIDQRVELIKASNVKIDELSKFVEQLIIEVRDGRAEKNIAGAVESPNYDTGKNEIFYNGIMILEITMEDRQLPLPKEAVGDLITELPFQELRSFVSGTSSPSSDSDLPL